MDRTTDTVKLGLLYEVMFPRFLNKFKNLEDIPPFKEVGADATIAGDVGAATVPGIAPQKINAPQANPSKITAPGQGLHGVDPNLSNLNQRRIHMMQSLNDVEKSNLPITADNYAKLGGSRGILDRLTTDRNWMLLMISERQKNGPIWQFMTTNYSHMFGMHGPPFSAINNMPVDIRKRMLERYFLTVTRYLENTNATHIDLEFLYEAVVF
jgi:hypothetical protein